jgi:hypothetical protein
VHLGHRLAIEMQHHRVRPTNNEQRWRLHAGERRSREIGPAATLYYGSHQSGYFRRR